MNSPTPSHLLATLKSAPVVLAVIPDMRCAVGKKSLTNHCLLNKRIPAHCRFDLTEHLKVTLSKVGTRSECGATQHLMLPPWSTPPPLSRTMQQSHPCHLDAVARGILLQYESDHVTPPLETFSNAPILFSWLGRLQAPGLEQQPKSLLWLT